MEVPTNASTGTGTGTVTVNTVTGVTTVTGSFMGLTGAATLGHLHAPRPAGGGNGPVLINFGGAGNTLDLAAAGNFGGTATLTPANVILLMGGQSYLNIHTAMNGGGEIAALVH